MKIFDYNTVTIKCENFNLYILRANNEMTLRN